MGQWMDVRSSLGCFILLFVGMFLLLLGIFWFEGVPFLFDFLFFYFSLFWRLLLVSGSALGHIALLECVGISGGCASVRNAPLSPESRYIPGSYCFYSLFGL
jgi:hypothetical membrane protein